MESTSTTDAPSLSGKIRQSIRQAYRVRGHKNENLWLVYSPKTDRDWLISSDRLLVHWLVNLEADQEVISFDLTTAESPNRSNSPFQKSVADVVYRDGRRITHFLTSISARPDHASLAGKLAQMEDDKLSEGVKYFHLYDLRETAPLAMRWLTAISFAAAIRDQHQAAATSAIAAYVHLHAVGSVRDISLALAGYDEAVVLGLAVRMSIQGILTLDMKTSTFGYTTQWTRRS